jgi:hypothetical protein
MQQQCHTSILKLVGWPKYIRCHYVYKLISVFLCALVGNTIVYMLTYSFLSVKVHGRNKLTQID